MNTLSALLLATRLPTTSFGHTRQVGGRSVGNAFMSDADDISKALQSRARIARDAIQSGLSFKQGLANVIAGEYDPEPVRAEINETISTNPCVMFTWEASPSCKKAVDALDKAGATYKIFRLDDPWDKGNKYRAELGAMVGRTSVPFIFINGEYIGGFDGGTGDSSPGLVEMAFKGTLRSKLMAAGALSTE
eukprot:CAMPEP_0169117596 /NCGR_PEP_ID=MMETSP1015-20121227/30550_1 /TAXON_ID=342587 /ORGANISM="Karlodinium micrum, Strain CCMP2283" /LENGTH=190 /DNA_ID=CAMNT_0009180305 /DNA_START=142 /DNA_END=714 /DNA_ORIENTATION=-